MYYNSLNQHLKSRFGTKIYKLALSGGMTCPNRDGKLGFGGCIFCSAKGSGDFAEPACESIDIQIKNAKSRIKKKAGKGAKYIAYFQDFTNTYAPVPYLKELFFKAILHPEIVGISIATRPDCLGDDVLKLISELVKIKPVWVELGLQTIHPKTVKYIRRGYQNEIYVKAVADLKKTGAEVVTHVILGLPHETPEMMLKTVKFCAQNGTDGIKLQLLHVLKNTDLEIDYNNKKFNVLSLDEYISILADCIRILPKNVVVHRLTGDGAKSELVAPLWSANKKLVLNTINQYFEQNIVVQGSV